MNDAILLLETLYRPEDLLWVGDRNEPGSIGDTVRTAGEWIAIFRNGGATAPHIIPNPLTGTPAPTKAGDKISLRGDSNVATYRFCMVEFDNLNKVDQIRFWSAIKLPIVCLIDSGGKSIHAWLEVSKLAQVERSGEWEEHVKCSLYNEILMPLGVDTACSNPARLSRLPGHYRSEKQAWQRLLWLSPEGRPICQK